MDILHIFELVGTFAFAITGALVASHKKMDIFGMTVLAIVTAMGGGMLRAALTGDYPIAFLTEPDYILVAILGAVIVFSLEHYVVKFQSPLVIADAIGLGIFLSLGVGAGLAHGYSGWASILLGSISATFGGVMRDVLAAEVPLIFRRELYATIALIGGLIYVILDSLGITSIATIFIAAGVTVALRLLAVRYDWSLPR
jgi:uncharacterized membrane protein YeiH